MGQFDLVDAMTREVSMKSGLEDRNNTYNFVIGGRGIGSLSEVRPRRPEQSCKRNSNPRCRWRRVSMKSGLECRNNKAQPATGRQHHPGLNEVRPRRPEQSFLFMGTNRPVKIVSMKSGLEGRNNGRAGLGKDRADLVSMKSGLEGRNNLTAKAFDSKTVFSLNEVRPRRPEQ